ncbi:MAG TPA: hypothetical protein VIG30_19395, partial [Ktedonobacterales bacterium]
AGIGTGVAFDWGLSAELLTFAALFAAGKMGGGGVPAGPGGRALGTVGSVVGAALTFALGEGLRRGRRPAWLAQVALNTLALPAGFILLPGTIADLRQGHVGSSVPTAILLFVGPALVWLLTRPRTRAWLRATTPAQASARHGGRWLVGIGAYALVGGVAVALARYY